MRHVIGSCWRFDYVLGADALCPRGGVDPHDPTIEPLSIHDGCDSIVPDSRGGDRIRSPAGEELQS